MQYLQPTENPLSTIKDDYQYAVLHIAWDRKKQDRTLIFAALELLPKEVPPPIDDGEKPFQPGKKSDRRVFLRHLVLSAEDALKWYENSRAGIVVRPDDNGKVLLSSPIPSKFQLRVFSLGEEPCWPSLVCMTSSSRYMVPFLAGWHLYPRLHHLLPANFRANEIWEQKEIVEIENFISEEMGFRFHDYPALMGSIHLIAPNPIFRGLDIRRAETHKGSQDSIVLRFHQREGASLSNLQLIIQEHRPSGTGKWLQISIKDPILHIGLNNIFPSSSVFVFDDQRGLLFEEGPATFLSSISLGVGASSTIRKVYDGDKKLLYEVPVTNEEMPVIVGDGPPSTSGLDLMQNIKQTIDERRLVASSGERWFRGGNEQYQEEAVRLMHTLIQPASQNIIIVDPYFRASELHFVLRVSNIKVPIKILSSAEVLKEHVSEEETLSKDILKLVRKRLSKDSYLHSFLSKRIQVTHGDQLLNALNNLSSSKSINKIEVHVMSGKRPEIHDRFLLVDNKVWLIGSSLNELGSRGTMITSVASAKLIKKELEVAWNRADALDVWLQKHRNRSSTLARADSK